MPSLRARPDVEIVTARPPGSFAALAVATADEEPSN
jgi:hypothetical protein